tara:strand:- start:261 stop:485 length:225 start_codon:yes stop_codon:yes gene_type:complete
MRRLKFDTFEINTYDNGVLHFVIGCEYKAIGTCGEAKDKEVKGILKYSLVNREVMLYNDYHGNISINEKTLRYL